MTDAILHAWQNVGKAYQDKNAHCELCPFNVASDCTLGMTGKSPIYCLALPELAQQADEDMEASE